MDGIVNIWLRLCHSFLIHPALSKEKHLKVFTSHRSPLIMRSDMSFDPLKHEEST